MSIDVLLGLQWGDEGKGKVVDYLAPHYDIIARFQGGPNAGHTLEFDGIKHVLHQIPSGIFRKHCINVIGNGVVLDPIIFKKECEDLIQYGINASDSIIISKKSHLILPGHKLLDHVYESAKAENKIGSTLRGIGPSYQDKIGRNGLRVGDIFSPDFEEKFKRLTNEHLRLANYIDGQEHEIRPEIFLESIEFLKKFKIINTEYMLHESLKNGKSILAEGAQGSLLDIDFGSYPFVTSSNTTIAGVCSGLGVSAKDIGDVIGITKAYCTRVGGGPFPTELHNETGKKLQRAGNEFGATTGRPRRCGWLDLVALNYSCMLNGVTKLFLMKVDVLNDFEEIKVGTHYNLRSGITSEEFAFNIEEEIESTHFESVNGWKSDLTNIKDYEEMPPELDHYVQLIENGTGVPIKFLSTGPGRLESVVRSI